MVQFFTGTRTCLKAIVLCVFISCSSKQINFQDTDSISLGNENEIKLTINKPFNDAITEYTYRDNTIYKRIYDKNFDSTENNRVLKLKVNKEQTIRFEELRLGFVKLDAQEDCSYCLFIEDGENWIIEYSHNNNSRKINRINPKTAKFFTEKNEQIDEPVESKDLINLISDLQNEFEKNF